MSRLSSTSSTSKINGAVSAGFRVIGAGSVTRQFGLGADPAAPHSSRLRTATAQHRPLAPGACDGRRHLLVAKTVATQPASLPVVQVTASHRRQSARLGGPL